MIIYLRLIFLISWSNLPIHQVTRTTSLNLFDLAPGGVYKLYLSKERLVVSYTTFSPLLAKTSGIFSVALSVNYLPGSYPALCSMESGLSSINRDYPFHILILIGYFIDLNKNLLFPLHHLKIVGQCTFELFYYLKLCVFLAHQKLLNKLLVCFLYRLRKLYLLFRIHL